MTLGLYVRRLNQIRFVEGVARAAHARGHRVLLLLDQRGSREGPKGEEWPDPEKVPERWRTWATVLPFDRLHIGLDAIVVPAPLGVDPADLPSGAKVYAGLQTNVTDVTRLAEPWRWSVVYTWSKAWALMGCKPVPPSGQMSTFRAIGHPLADMLPTIDRAEVRRTFGLPDRPIVLYFPFPFGAHEQPWRLRYLYRWAPWGDRATVRAVRAFCDRQGAALVVKSRAKTEVPGYLRRAADVVVERDEPGEATSLRLLSVADLLVHHLSSGAMEALLVGVPSLYIRPDGWLAYDEHLRLLGSEFYGTEWRPGAMDIPSRRGWNAGLDATRRARYLGPEPFAAGQRIVDDLEERVG